MRLVLVNLQLHYYSTMRHSTINLSLLQFLVCFIIFLSCDTCMGLCACTQREQPYCNKVIAVAFLNIVESTDRR